MAKLDDVLGKAAEASKQKTDLSYGSTAKPKRVKAQVKRTEPMRSNLRPKEKDDFLNLQGRKTESNAVRELVIAYTQSKEIRQAIDQFVQDNPDLID